MLCSCIVRWNVAALLMKTESKVFRQQSPRTSINKCCGHRDMNTIVIIIFSNNITPIEVHLHQQFIPNNYDGCQIVSNAFHLQLLTVWYPVQNHDCLSKPVSDTIDKIQLQCCKDALLIKQLLSGEPVLHQSRWDRQQKGGIQHFNIKEDKKINNMKTEYRHYFPSFKKPVFFLVISIAN